MAELEWWRSTALNAEASPLQQFLILPRTPHPSSASTTPPRSSSLSTATLGSRRCATITTIPRPAPKQGKQPPSVAPTIVAGYLSHLERDRRAAEPLEGCRLKPIYDADPRWWCRAALWHADWDQLPRPRLPVPSISRLEHLPS